MPAKRVSLKGQGADLFFGGIQPPSVDEQLPDQAPVEAAASGPDATSLPTEMSPAPDPDDLPQLDLRADEPIPPPAAGDIPGSNNGDIAGGKQYGYHASSRASMHDKEIEAIRRVVKQTGREVSFVRLSAEEKGRLADIVYTYRRQGRKTTENELNRIAINALLDDYDAHGAQSVLARVLDALHA